MTLLREYDSTPDFMADAGGLCLKLSTPIGVYARAARAASDLVRDVRLSDGSRTHLPPTYANTHVRAYLRSLIVDALRRLLAALDDEADRGDSPDPTSPH